MQTFPFEHHHILTAFDLLLARKPLTLEGYTFKHDQHFDGRATLYHLFCIDNASGKAIWHAWRVHGSAWTEELSNRAVMNRMFSLCELVSFQDVLYYDPMHLIKLPHRHKAQAVMSAQSHTQPNGFIRTNIGGQMGGMIPGNYGGGGMFPNGPSDYPFIPGPGLPMQPQFGQFNFQPQYQQASSVTAYAGLPNAARAALELLNPGEQAYYRTTLQQLVTTLNNPAIWIWNDEADTDPKTEFTYKDGNYPRGVQRLMRKLLILAIERFGFKARWSTPDMETTILKISIDLSLEEK